MSILVERLPKLFRGQDYESVQCANLSKKILNHFFIRNLIFFDRTILKLMERFHIEPAVFAELACGVHRMSQRFCSTSELMQSSVAYYQSSRNNERLPCLLTLIQNFCSGEVPLLIQAFGQQVQVRLPSAHGLNELKPQPHGSRFLVLLSSPRFRDRDADCNADGEQRSNGGPSIPIDYAFLAQPPALANAIPHTHPSVPLSQEAILP
ncbi:hypothetical protein QSH35_014020 [Xanthomonas arboricola pv. juglandis]|uniref:hypothetical protein n=1 Tax=Xanthomonas arboricola TaxID=56448 RepID=UPI0025AEFCE1|nr:hypothetical protein [Xanthomonas arboricola]MDN0220804.1 hypothetical protein [Xanthomonas arboricola pv. juglandis]MDN0246123.1 hypothetical protein [Xanthomonas arboricola pv. juglandis]